LIWLPLTVGLSTEKGKGNDGSDVVDEDVDARNY